MHVMYSLIKDQRCLRTICFVVLWIWTLWIAEVNRHHIARLSLKLQKSYFHALVGVACRAVLFLSGRVLSIIPVKIVATPLIFPTAKGWGENEICTKGVYQGGVVPWVTVKKERGGVISERYRYKYIKDWNGIVNSQDVKFVKHFITCIQDLCKTW